MPAARYADANCLPDSTLTPFRAACVEKRRSASAAVRTDAASHFKSPSHSPLGSSPALSNSTSPGDQLEVSSTSVGSDTQPSFYSCAPRLGMYTALISSLLQLGAGNAPQMHRWWLRLGVVEGVCESAVRLLRREPALLDIAVSASEELVVVGDIHGQFDDLYRSVLSQQHSTQHNPTRADKKFLFLGDFVDRGPHSLEVVLLILALKVEYPNHIFLMRGNHEDVRTSKVYGFFAESVSKLGALSGEAAWASVNRVFRVLPLAASVTTPKLRFFAAHGGLSPHIVKDVRVIHRVDREEYGRTLKHVYHCLVDGLLWSDPVEEPGAFKHSPRGCGYAFGSAATAEFCRSNGYRFVCRAHQVAMDGYLWGHDGRVVTVFSAPNYCGISQNLGAIMVVSGSIATPLFYQYDAAADVSGTRLYPPATKQLFPFSSLFL